MTVKKVHYRGDVPKHIKRFAEWLVGLPVNIASLHIRNYQTFYRVCLGGANAESAWMGPWDGAGEWFVDLEC